MNDRADFRQQEELERERWETTMEALSRAQELGLDDMYLRHLASECGISNYQPHAKRRTASVG